MDAYRSSTPLFDPPRQQRVDLQAAAGEDTDFKARWEKYARLVDLPSDMEAPMPTTTVAEHRRRVLEFFSCGLVHGERQRQRLKELLPDDTSVDAVLRDENERFPLWFQKLRSDERRHPASRVL